MSCPTILTTACPQQFSPRPTRPINENKRKGGLEVLGSANGIRTHTERILSPFPLPIGILRHIKIELKTRRVICFTYTLTRRRILRLRNLPHFPRLPSRAIGPDPFQFLLMVPHRGLEPRTFGLRDRYSAC